MLKKSVVEPYRSRTPSLRTAVGGTRGRRFDGTGLIVVYTILKQRKTFKRPNRQGAILPPPGMTTSHYRATTAPDCSPGRGSGGLSLS